MYTQRPLAGEIPLELGRLYRLESLAMHLNYLRGMSNAVSKFCVGGPTVTKNDRSMTVAAIIVIIAIIVVQLQLQLQLHHHHHHRPRQIQ